MAKLEIHQFSCLSDNFGVLIHDAEAGVTASIDAPETKAVEAALKEKGWTTNAYPDDASSRRSYRREFGR